MGTDIHIYLECWTGEQWVMEREIRGPAIARNYERFARIAGVRGRGVPLKGLPVDVSESVRWYAGKWNGDAHGYSWMPVTEAGKVWAVTESDGERDFERSRISAVQWYFGVEPREEETRRIVYWFDC